MDAVLQVLAQEICLHAGEGGANGFYLRDDVDAVAIVLDHF